jgi:uncharacterized protein (TIGR02453 family)
MPSRSATKPAAAKEPQHAHPYFSAQALDFLRKLKRNNRREWFQARRDAFENDLKQPMLSLIEKITEGMADYAPAHLRPPQKSMLRIYRDTRFSADKTPYKTNLAAWWARNGAEKTSGSGYYMHISATEIVVAAGVYMPPKEQLYAIRQHLLEHHAEFKRLIDNKKLRAKFTLHDPMTLTRPPKGFAPDHPAIEWIKWRQWGVTATLPVEEALKPSLPATIGAHFRLTQPLVDFLNQPLFREAEKRKKPLFGLY